MPLNRHLDFVFNSAKGGAIMRKRVQNGQGTAKLPLTLHELYALIDFDDVKDDEESQQAESRKANVEV